MTAQPGTNTADWTIGRLLAWTVDYLHSHKVDEPRLSTEVLLANALDCRRIDLYARFDQIPDNGGVAHFREWVRRAADHEPIAYLVEEKEFFSLSFRVTSDVLIPRPETETLVECVIDHCAKLELDQPRLLELGTGSGCIAVALLTQIPGASVVATDVSTAALEIARHNAERHNVTDRIALIEADRLAIPADEVPDGGFDLLVSNPPYVTTDEMKKLDTTVRRHEPSLALSDGGDGLSFYEAIASDAPGVLASGGAIFVEIGDNRSQDVLGRVEPLGSLAHERTWKDRVTGHERVMKFIRRKEE